MSAPIWIEDWLAARGDQNNSVLSFLNYFVFSDFGPNSTWHHRIYVCPYEFIQCYIDKTNMKIGVSPNSVRRGGACCCIIGSPRRMYKTEG